MLLRVFEEEHEEQVNHCQFTNTAHRLLLATCSNDKFLNVKVWLLLFWNHVSLIHIAAFLLTLSASIYAFLCVKLWNLNKPSSQNTMFGHFEPVNHCCFSPNDTYLSTSSNDGTVKVSNIWHRLCLGNLLVDFETLWTETLSCLQLTDHPCTPSITVFSALPSGICQWVEDDRRQEPVDGGRRRRPCQVQHLDRRRQAHHLRSQECCAGQYFLYGERSVGGYQTHSQHMNLLWVDWILIRVSNLCSFLSLRPPRCLMLRLQTCCLRSEPTVWARCSTVRPVPPATCWLSPSPTMP